jgi:hypothetical protein
MTYQRFINGFNHILGKAGESVRIKYYTQSTGSVYDDDVTLTNSGNSWVSGIILSLNGITSSEDANLLEQGKLINSDKKIFFNGSIVLIGSILQVKIQIGSPTGDNYSVIPDGTQTYEVNGIPVYKKVYIRKLINGSLFGE